MKTTKQTKMQLLDNVRQHLKYERERERECIHMEEIINDVETLSDLKLTLVDYANKFYHIRTSQQNKQVQWYLGDRFYYSQSDIFSYLHAIHRIAEITNYNLSSSQGFWFIKSY